MDRSETVVEAFLKRMGFRSVVFEPDGNVPPDFLADGRIAIEVRRLNQNHDDGNGKRGLEEVSIPLWQKMKNLGHSFGSADGESWFLCFRFGRPVKPWNELAPRIEAALCAFKRQSIRVDGRVFTDGEFEIDVVKATQPLETFFCIGSSSDYQSGGAIVAEMLTNIAYCADEKQKKIANYKAKYNEWWLVLTNHVGFGLGDYDRKQLLEHAKRPAAWDKIIVVSPSDPSNWFEF